MSHFQIYEKLQDDHALHAVLFLSLVSRAPSPGLKLVVQALFPSTQVPSREGVPHCSA